MSQQLLRKRLTATLAIASLSIAMPVRAETLQASTIRDGSDREQVPPLNVSSQDTIHSDESQESPSLSTESGSASPAEEETSLAKVGTFQSPRLDPVNAAIATIYAHEMDGRSAATVYVRNLPIFTFLGLAEASTPPPTQPDAILASGDGLNSEDPVVRATVLSSQLNQYSLEGIDPDNITVRWNADTEEIFVEAGNELLLSVDESVILPDTTGDVAEDALQATNRLRRQLGSTEELNAISGLPTEPVRVARSTFSGMASWYGPGFHGRISASGERFNQNAMTAAHRTLPFGTIVQVTNLNTGVSTIVRINDRGPYSHGRVIDLSAAAASAIGMMGSGVAPVSVDVLE